MCIAITNTLEHDSLVSHNMLLENIIQVTGIPVIVTDQNGNIIYENQFAQTLLEREFADENASKLTDSIIKNISLIQKIHTDNICRRVHTQFTNRSCIYNVQTSISDFMPPTYISIINETSDAWDFVYLNSILSEREIEIVGLIAQGFNNSDIGIYTYRVVDEILFIKT